MKNTLGFGKGDALPLPEPFPAPLARLNGWKIPSQVWEEVMGGYLPILHCSRPVFSHNLGSSHHPPTPPPAPPGSVSSSRGGGGGSWGNAVRLGTAGLGWRGGKKEEEPGVYVGRLMPRPPPPPRVVSPLVGRGLPGTQCRSSGSVLRMSGRGKGDGERGVKKKKKRALTRKDRGFSSRWPMTLAGSAPL